MKYIDTEKLIAEIKRLNSLVLYESKDRHDDGLHDAYKAVENVIDSLRQEQSSLSSNLYEAADKYIESQTPADQGEEMIIYKAFKAGAEWAIKQLKEK